MGLIVAIDARRAEAQQKLAGGLNFSTWHRRMGFGELENLSAATSGEIGLGVGNPDIVIPIHPKAVRIVDHVFAEHSQDFAVRAEMNDGIDMAVFAVGGAAAPFRDPDRLAVIIDLDAARAAMKRPWGIVYQT